MKNLKEVVVVAYGRSAIGKAGKGTLMGEFPSGYAAEVLRGVLAKIPELPWDQIDDVLVGCSSTRDVQGSNFGRIVAQRAGIPDSVPAATVNRFCSSGLQTIAMAANAIMADQADVIVAGGAESMSWVPVVRDITSYDPWLHKNKPANYMPMGDTAELVAEKYGITRQEQDAFSVKSNQKAARARENGEFKKEIIPVSYVDKDGNQRLFTEDEGIRPDSSVEALAKLRPAFKDGGTVTAGSSSQVSDGAGFVVLMSMEKAQELGIKPIAKFLGYQVAGVDPAIMGVGPMEAVPKLLKKLDMRLDQFDVIELNEAFAAQSIPCIRELGLDESKVNPRGGAIAMGHPMGATGAILTCKALSYLEDTKGRYAMVTMCIGGGMGAAGAYEML